MIGLLISGFIGLLTSLVIEQMKRQYHMSKQPKETPKSASRKPKTDEEWENIPPRPILVPTNEDEQLILETLERGDIEGGFFHKEYVLQREKARRGEGGSWNMKDVFSINWRVGLYPMNPKGVGYAEHIGHDLKAVINAALQALKLQ